TKVHALGGLVTAAHPFANCFACGYEFSYQLADLVEVWNGPWTPDDEQAVSLWDGLLRSGCWIPAVGNSDAHRPPSDGSPGDLVGLPQTVVLADSLRTPDLLAGLKAGRCYLAESAEVEVSFTASAGGTSAGIGERLPVDIGDPVTVEVRVSGVPETTVSILDQSGPRVSADVPADGARTLTWTTYPRHTQWVRVEVRRASGGLNSTTPNAMVAMTNPI